MADFRDDPVAFTFELGPGGIIVIAPNGYFNGHMHASGFVCVEAKNIDLVGTENGMTRAHRTIVDERWGLRNIDGSFIPQFVKAPPIPKALQGKKATRDDPRPVPDAETQGLEKFADGYLGGWNDACDVVAEALVREFMNRPIVMTRESIKRTAAEVVAKVRQECQTDQT